MPLASSSSSSSDVALRAPSFPPCGAAVAQQALRSRHRKALLQRFLVTVQQRLLGDAVSSRDLVKAAQVLRPADFEMVVEERAHERRCGFPGCCNPLAQHKQAKYRIDRRNRKVFDATSGPLLSFCSEQCYLSSQQYKLSLSDDPIELRRALPFESLSQPSDGVYEHEIEVAPAEENDEAPGQKTDEAYPQKTDSEQFEDQLHDIAAREMAKLKLDDAAGATQTSRCQRDMEEDSALAELMSTFNAGEEDIHEAATKLEASLTPFSRIFMLFSEWTRSDDARAFLRRLSQGYLDNPLGGIAHVDDDRNELQAIYGPRKDIVSRFVMMQLSPVLSALQFHANSHVHCLARRLLPQMIATFNVASAAPALTPPQWQFVALCCVALLVHCTAQHSQSSDMMRDAFHLITRRSSESLAALLAQIGFEFDHLQLVVDSVMPL